MNRFLPFLILILSCTPPMKNQHNENIVKIDSISIHSGPCFMNCDNLKYLFKSNGELIVTDNTGNKYKGKFNFKEYNRIQFAISYENLLKFKCGSYCFACDGNTINMELYVKDTIYKLFVGNCMDSPLALGFIIDKLVSLTDESKWDNDNVPPKLIESKYAEDNERQIIETKMKRLEKTLKQSKDTIQSK